MVHNVIMSTHFSILRLFFKCVFICYYCTFTVNFHHDNTYVLILTGGELVLRHSGTENTFDYARESLDDAHYIAFYADVKHQIKPLKSGFRIALIYNLVCGHQLRQFS